MVVVTESSGGASVATLDDRGDCVSCGGDVNIGSNGQ